MIQPSVELCTPRCLILDSVRVFLHPSCSIFVTFFVICLAFEPIQCNVPRVNSSVFLILFEQNLIVSVDKLLVPSVLD